MRKLRTLILCVILFGAVSSCSVNNSSEEATFQQVDPLSLKDSNLTEVLKSNINDGVYELRTDKKCYIIFNSIEQSYEDITYKTEKDTFQIIFSTDKLIEKNQIVYKLVLPENIDTIELIQDGEEAAFQSIYL